MHFFHKTREVFTSDLYMMKELRQLFLRKSNLYVLHSSGSRNIAFDEWGIFRMFFLYLLSLWIFELTVPKSFAASGESVNNICLFMAA